MEIVDRRVVVLSGKESEIIEVHEPTEDMFGLGLRCLQVINSARETGVRLDTPPASRLWHDGSEAACREISARTAAYVLSAIDPHVTAELCGINSDLHY
jgi:hypothetical protein